MILCLVAVIKCLNHKILFGWREYACRTGDVSMKKDMQ